MHIIEGYFIGLATVIFIGPVLFILINATIKNGLKSGIGVALGIIIGDIIFAVISFIGINEMSFYFSIAIYNDYLSIVGALLLLAMGILYLRKKEVLSLSNNTITNKTHFQNFLKGFAINFFNPFVFAYWIMFSKYATNKFANNADLFIAAMLFGILTIDLVKVFLANKLLSFLHSKKLLLFYKFSGIIMILFALRIMYSFLL